VNRRAFVTGFGAVLAAPYMGNAQTVDKKARVGFLLMGSPERAGLAPAFDAFRDGLREFGWIDNENMPSNTDGRENIRSDFPSLQPN
jgi:hypothetical protein